MNTKAIFTIVAIVAAIGMLGMATVAIPSVPQAHAQARGGEMNGNQFHPAVNAHPDAKKPNFNPTESCAPISAGGGGHSNLGEPCTG